MALNKVKNLFRLNQVNPSSPQPDDDDLSLSIASSNQATESLTVETLAMTGLCKANPTTKSGQRLYMIQMLFLPFLPFVALMLEKSFSLTDLVRQSAQIEGVGVQVDRAIGLQHLLSNLQRERSELSFAMIADTLQEANAKKTLKSFFDATDHSLDSLYWPDSFISDDCSPKIFKSKLRFQIKLDDFRQSVINKKGVTFQEVIDWYKDSDYTFLIQFAEDLKSSNTSRAWKYLVSYDYLLRGIENFGLSMSQGYLMYLYAPLPEGPSRQMIQHEVVSSLYFNKSMDLHPHLKEELDRSKSQNYREWRLMLNSVKYQTGSKFTLEGLRIYHQTTVTHLEEIRMVIHRITSKMSDIVNEDSSRFVWKQSMNGTILCLVIVIAPSLIILVKNATLTLQTFSVRASQRTEEIASETERADKLLYQILPKGVARKLLKGKLVPAETFDSATVYFSAIDGFTNLVAESTPLEVVTLINSLYKMFDARIDRYDVYKVEAINDTYMVASGLPKRNGDRHAGEIATMALDLLGRSKNFTIPHRPGETLQMRSGIHTGPVVTGVVGAVMPKYCLVGDTVNTASRMQSTGLPLRIQISKETKLLLDTLGHFKIDHRGLTQVKGKGLLDTYWLVSSNANQATLDEFELIYKVEDGPAFMKNLDDIATAPEGNEIEESKV